MKPILISVTSPGTDFQAYLMIDSMVNGRAYGGVRISPVFSLDVLRDIARAMTLKHGFLGLPLGGAKALIVAPSNVDPDAKKQLLTKFGEGLKPFITTRRYVPSGDLGVYDADIRYLLRSVGITTQPRGLHDSSGFYTGLTVCTAGIAAASQIGLDLSQATVAVEGFGSVGTSAALAYWLHGLKVVAISTRLGAIYAREGLNVPQLIELRKQVGDRVVQVFPDAEKLDPDRLLEMKVDILSPCGHSHSINSANAAKVSAKILSPGANAPVAADADGVIHDSGVLFIPDFVANCGGAMGTSMHVAGLGDGYIRNFIERTYRLKVEALIQRAREKKVLLKSYATAMAEEKFMRVKNSVEKKSAYTGVLNLLLELYHFRLIPSFAVKIIAPSNFERRFASD